MLIQYIQYSTGHNCNWRNQFFTPPPQKKQNNCDHFKGLLMTHNLDIFMSGIKWVKSYKSNYEKKGIDS